VAADRAGRFTKGVWFELRGEGEHGGSFRPHRIG
jgi:hypothetical protein